MDLSVLPNIITVIRLLLVIPVALAISESYYGTALLLFAVASISDGIDGFLARQFNWMSRFGAMMDPLADKLLLVVTFITLTYMGFIPMWLAIVVIGRDLIIVSGAVSYHLLYGAYEFSPTWLGKISTTCQFLLVILYLVHLSLVPVPADILLGGCWWVFVVSSLSGLDYVVSWTRKALDH